MLINRKRSSAVINYSEEYTKQRLGPHISQVPRYETLIKAVGAEMAKDFAFMGRIAVKSPGANRAAEVELYKHKVTGVYLNLDRSGRNAYEVWGWGYKRTEQAWAVEKVREAVERISQDRQQSQSKQAAMGA